MFKELLKDKKKLGIYLAVVIIGVFTVFKYFSGGYKDLKKNSNEEEIFVEDTSNENFETEEAQVKLKEKNIVVEIKGEVKKPDVYTMSEDSIVKDLIDNAGGTTENADLTTINRAKKLQNHELIYIKNKNEASDNVQSHLSSQTAESSVSEESSMVNLNTASAEELKSLSGIGDSKANNIIEYREKNGGFASTNDLMNVKGIGEGIFEQIKDKIEV